MTQTELATQKAKNGEFLEAMKIMKSWRMIPKETSNTISRALSANLSPEFYKGMGQNPQILFNEGVEAVKKFLKIA